MSFVPVLSIKESVLLPDFALRLKVGRKQNRTALEYAQKNGGLILALSQKSDFSAELIAPLTLHQVGTLSKIEKVKGSTKNDPHVLLRGISRFKVTQFQEKDGMIFAEGEEWKDEKDADPTIYKSILEALKTLAQKIISLLPQDTRQITDLIKNIDDLSYLTHLCTENLEMETEKKQTILETVNLKDRALVLLEIMQKQKEALEVQREIREKLGQKLEKHQRESLLREQLRTIKEELGETGDREEKEKNDLSKRMEEAGIPEEVLKVAREEMDRLEGLNPQSPDYQILRSYLEYLVSLPWSQSSSESKIEELGLSEARQTLDKDHYGLKKVKDRILQHLAVMKLKKGGRGQILLLVGPPGVGKTSLGQSIATAMGRKFVRASLGGVRDDAEIRGHRRTYIGAMPGRIIQGIKRAGENNPVFMLDEIDKMGRGFHGDPGAALLEVLDPEQNSSFSDHYLNVPFDLSRVFFIATANGLDSIPGPLMDRMEVIDLAGYTKTEKFHIAKDHLLPKQWKEHGLTPEQLVVSDEALIKIIQAHTREAGVRDLQRKLGSLCRGMAERVLTASPTSLPLRIAPPQLEELLGPEKYTPEIAEKMNPPGVTTGLAWTPFGGEILFIEAILMPGKGHLTITGQLGDVMKESAQIALGLIRSRLAHAIPGLNLETKDIHVHVPAGAIPKDGPSAGITMLTTLASLLTGKTVSPKLAMTGELTLRGAVLPVGGIKEKMIAAHQAGIEHVILSRKNEKDLRDVPEEILTTLKFSFVDTASEVLKIALNLDALESYFPPLLGEEFSKVRTAI